MCIVVLLNISWIFKAGKMGTIFGDGPDSARNLDEMQLACVLSCGREVNISTR